MSYMRDARARRLDTFDAARDLPRVILDLDCYAFTRPDGTALYTWGDRSGGGRDVKSYANTPPTLTTIGGLRAVHFGVGAGMARREFGQGLGEPATYAQPNTLIAVVRLSSAITAQRAIMGAGATTNRQTVLLNTTTQVPSLFAGSTGAWGGRSLADDQWHVVTAVFGVATTSIYVDGYLWTCTNATAGAEAMLQVAIGCTTSTGQVASNTVDNADYRQVIVSNAELSPGQVLVATAGLATKWGITQTLPSEQGAASYTDDVDSSGQAIRYWLPRAPSLTGNTLVIWSHPYSQNQIITPGYFSYPLVQTAVNEGWIVAASNMHADQWGNATAQTDLLNLYNYVNSRWPVSKVVLVGGSMGGGASAIALSKGTVPNVKGVATLDGVLNLANMYANASYTAPIKTAFGVAADGSDYSTKTAGYDPMLLTVSTLTGARWRFYAGDADTTVPPANHADPFAAMVAAAPEAAVMRHSRAHLSPDGAWSDDFAAFVKRCIA